MSLFKCLNLNICLKVLVQGYSDYNIIIVMTIMDQWRRPKDGG